jgi:hypothetical protein
MPANRIDRSAFYDTPEARARDVSIVAEIKTICDELEPMAIGVLTPNYALS